MSFDMNISAPVIGIVLGATILALALTAFILWRIEDIRVGKYLAGSDILRERHPGDEGALHVIDDDFTTLFGEGISNSTVDEVVWEDVEREAGR